MYRFGIIQLKEPLKQWMFRVSGKDHVWNKHVLHFRVWCKGYQLADALFWPPSSYEKHDVCACLSLNRAPFSESSAFDFTSRVHSIVVSQHIFLNRSRLTSQRAGCSAIVGMTCQDSNLGEGHPIKKEKKRRISCLKNQCCEPKVIHIPFIPSLPTKETPNLVLRKPQHSPSDLIPAGVAYLKGVELVMDEGRKHGAIVFHGSGRIGYKKWAN